MPIFKLPLSGDVVQSISPWTAFMSPIGNQLGLVNVTIGQSSEPAVEADVLSDVASYGKQLGRIGDALVVLLAHFRPATPLTREETTAIDDLKELLGRIADVKERHKREALRPLPHLGSPPSPAAQEAVGTLPPATPAVKPAAKQPAAALTSAPSTMAASSRPAARKRTSPA